MNIKILIIFLLLTVVMINNKKETNLLEIEIYQTSSAGDQLTAKESSISASNTIDTITLFPNDHFQKISGFGGAFTQSSAFLLNNLSTEKRAEIIDAYFSEDGANYSLCRTHINSCDFSTHQYSYASVKDDIDLQHFSIERDKQDIIPMIKAAQKASKEGFNIIASPWTAPPWMKDNQAWNGGKLLPKYYPTWALYFSKYIKEYAKEGINIWGLTVENEPLGNDSNWESMHYTPEEMGEFVKKHLGPQLQKDQLNPKLLVYDQNRGKELEEWAEKLLKDEELSQYVYGTAVHWYNSTVDWMPASLTYTHDLAPEKHIIHTEGCIDAEAPKWKNDQWYWQKEATDWGWDWAPEEDKKDHPKYVPVYRYARDIIGCLNNWVEGWIDWNMVLDQNGGPNSAKNWCIAPIIVNTESDEIYYTPLYYTLTHFSRFIRPNATRIGFHSTNNNVMCTATKNQDGSIAVVLLNMNSEGKEFRLMLGNKTANLRIDGAALQTIIIKS